MGDSVSDEIAKGARNEVEHGCAEVQFNLGLMCRHGQGVTQSYSEAANQGDAEAQNNLGVMYEYGRGVRQSFSKAKEFYGQACDDRVQDGCDKYKE